MGVPDRLQDTVRRNCDISDARHAGGYSVCSLALRLRELHKWEQALEPWEEPEPAKLLGWIDARERLWETLAGRDYAALPAAGGERPAFDCEGVNAELTPRGLFYGALYGRRLKPMFFLGAVEERRLADGLPVVVIGRELARDLSAAPALSVGETIVVRRQTARLQLWEQIAYLRRSQRAPLAFALRRLGGADSRPATVRRLLPALLSARLEACIRHEAAELQETEFGRDAWRRVVAAWPQTPVELLARACRDLLADTHPRGPLRDMLRRRDAVGLALHAALADGLPAALFPQLQTAFAAFAATGDWEAPARAVECGRSTGRRWAQMIVERHAEGERRGDLAGSRSAIEDALRRLEKNPGAQP